MFHLVFLFNKKKKFANLGRGKTKRAKKKGRNILDNLLSY
jgi:hypothetical protein